MMYRSKVAELVWNDFLRVKRKVEAGDVIDKTDMLVMSSCVQILHDVTIRAVRSCNWASLENEQIDQWIATKGV